jgi:hypothetical protein
MPALWSDRGASTPSLLLSLFPSAASDTGLIVGTLVESSSAQSEELPQSVEAQRAFYFGKDRLKHARFRILPDPNGHNVCASSRSQQ